jgi:methylenetetrahydrofolate dehydrogenase (NADP+)/methenyltetrahydrofolate cyclohydrolase
MRAIILDGSKKADEIKRELSGKIKLLKHSIGSVPRLAALQIGEGSAFSVYANSQKRIAGTINMDYELVKLAASISEQDLIEKIIQLNKDKNINGIILQSPLPEGFDVIKITSFISSDKDVEGISPENKGKLLLNAYKVVPPTASAAMELINLSGIDLYGKEAAIIGHSGIVGKPLAMLLLDKFATVTVCHIATSEKGNLIEHIRRAEVLIVAVGKPKLVKGEWIKEHAVVIDIGINKVDGKIVGDVEFDKASERASYITPVPGGVGPLTTTMLMRNCVELFQKQKGVR